MKKYLAELIGTFVLTFIGCGAAVALSCGSDTASVLGTALAFGLSLVAVAYAIGGLSGCHINPAVTLGMFFCGRIGVKEGGMYMISQAIGAILGAAALTCVTSTVVGDPLASSTLTGANVCHFGVTNGLIVEVLLTAVFVFVALAATSKTNGATNNFAGIAIGVALIVVYLVGIKFTGASVNPARSIGPAIFEGGKALSDLWVFIIGPFVGGAIAALVWRAIANEDHD
ncbi:MAG: aquaporin [Prevotella sp.]|nr:aquaporin [Prevotella sp.]